MFLGMGFLSVLTAAIASHFVAVDTGASQVLAALERLEGEVAEIKSQLDRDTRRVASGAVDPPSQI